MKYVDKIIEYVKEAFSAKNRKQLSSEAIACVAMLGIAFKDKIAERMKPVLGMDLLVFI